MRRLDRRGWWMLGLAAGAAVAGASMAACAHRQTTTGAVPRAERPPRAQLAAAGPCQGNGVTPDLACPELPNTNAVGQWVAADGVTPSDHDTGYLDFDLWAWNSFIAMNWPALDPATHGNRRGLPGSGTFAGVSSSDTVVWETFKEKREVFLAYTNGQRASQVPQPWTAAPVYGPTEPPGSQVPCCEGAVCPSTGFERHLGTASKFTFNSLDEDVEVPSEALETRAALCQGWVDPDTQCTGQPTDNTCCTLNTQPTMPRVWKGNPYPSPASATPVLYEVKLNYDSFQYILNNQYYDQTTARSVASDPDNGPITLPARTSAGFNPPPPGARSFPTMASQAGPNPSVTSYSASACLAGLPSAITPCPAGAVHLKAAWIELSDECGEATSSTYHTACAYKYLTSSQPGGICKQPALFGLIGLHIIQRIHVNNPAHVGQGSDGAQGPPLGGTYVFASWEHAGNFAADAGFTYANYSKAPPTGSTANPAPFPNIAAAPALPLTRAYSLLDSTTRANTLIHNLLGCPASNSVWCNYHLIGTQYMATNLPSPEPTQLLTGLPASPSPGIEAPAGSGQPYYLANLVVESNVGLQQFQGLPISAAPGVITVLPHWSNVSARFTSQFQRMGDNVANLAFRTQSNSNSNPRSMQFNMGGCMGCHGVAQLSGYSFSFVLLDNQGGAVPDALPPSGP